MKALFNNNNIIYFILFIILTSSLGYWFVNSQNNSTTESLPSDAESVVQVKTIKLQEGVIQQSLKAYGMVLPLPNKLKTISVSYASLVDEVQVTPGQLIEPGDLLLTLKPAPSALLQLKQARSELTAATQENNLLKQRLHLKLATQQDLVSSQLRLKQAQAMLKNMNDQGVNKKQEIKANKAGIIYQSNVQQGQIMSPGSPLLQWVDQTQWTVRLGIEPEDYHHLQTGQPVFISPVNTPVSEPVKGRINIISHQIDISTRLVNVFVKPELNQTLLINDFVQGQIVIASKKTLLVPSQAVLPDGDSHSLFTIEKGHAVKHQVQIGLQNDQYVEVINADLKSQDEVVILGNYELESGMSVSIIHTDTGVIK